MEGKKLYLSTLSPEPSTYKAAISSNIKPTMASLKLTDLPIEMQSLIVAKLSGPSRLSPSHSPALRSDVFRKLFWERLPDDLLRAAQASPILAKAVIHAIGPRVGSLSFMQTKRLWEWMPILKGHVNAIDFAGVDLFQPYPQLRWERYRLGDYRQEKATLNTLEALYGNDLQLEELNLSQLKLFDRKQPEKMAAHVEKAIQRSSASLKRIYLKACPAIVQAMKNITLPKLVTVHISMDIFTTAFEIKSLYRYFSERDLCQILKALRRDAAHTSNTSTIRELNLHMLHFVPDLKFETCPRLFLGVKKLSLIFHHQSNQAGVAKFITNFKNLESLRWSANKDTIRAVKNMKTIFTACPELKHLNLVRNVLSRRSEEIGIPRHPSGMNDFFRSFRGQLQTVNLHYLTSEQIIIFGEHSPNLTTLYLSIDHETVEALSLLLGTHCRQLRELHLEYSRDADQCLGKDGWSDLSNAIRSASPCFHTVSLIDNMYQLGHATEGMVDAIIDILEFMGDRAKKVRFKTSMKTDSPLFLFKGLWQTLKSAGLHSKSIQNLCFDFFPDYSGSDFERQLLVSQEKTGEIHHRYEAICKLRNVLSAFKYMEEIDVGNIDNVYQCYRGR